MFRTKRIKDIGIEDRPRERLLKKGAEALKDEDLVAILIHTGTKEKDVRKVASDVCRILHRGGQSALREGLKKVKGMGDAKITTLLAAVEFGSRYGEKHTDKNCNAIVTGEDVWNEMIDIRKSRKEHFVIFYLNSRSGIIERDIISVGTLNASLVHPREVFAKAIERNCASIIAAHNHPSGDTEPSDADLSITERLVNAGKILGIEVDDHIIVTKDSHYSIKENNPELFD